MPASQSDRTARLVEGSSAGLAGNPAAPKFEADPRTSAGPKSARAGRAAEYLRMSTDQQRYSLQAQSEAIHAYAERHGLEIVRSYVDAGKSGTTLEGRDGLKALISDVVNGQTDFEAVIVLDVSRWGRFPS